MASGVHFLMIPLMCPGHLIPMVDMAKLIAQQFATVTILITPRNAAKFGAVLHRAMTSGLPIRILQLQFPASELYGLPEGCENVDDLPTLKFMKNFFDATAKLQEPLEEVFGDLKPRPSCIISDKNLHWTADVARKFEIPWVIFDGMSCFTRLATHNLYGSNIHEQVGDFDPFLLPGLPDNITMTRSQLPGLFNPRKKAQEKEIKILREKIRAAELRAYGIVINSFEELEKRYIDEYRKVTGKVWCIGPFSQSNKNDLDKAQRGTKASIESHECITWLESQQPGSVVYACLGSLIRVTTPQFIELALGLEESKFPFILVEKGGSRSEEIEKWLIEDGFEERVKGRGVLIRGWAPQVLILSHPSVGAFLTHCGWNSTIEGICAGVPMITWPQFSEQFFNERLAVDVVGTGVSVGAESVMQVGEEDVARVQVKREDVCNAVKTVMDEGIEGKNRREKAKYFREMSEMALEEGGSSHLNLKLFIEDIMLHVNKGVAG
ncbi:hypothetical protein L1887_00946 [Cichorium endivia]|nr:hypothetical protein L1887_00946 [Cichorium endivia]